MDRPEKNFVSLNVRLAKWLGYWPDNGRRITVRMVFYLLQVVTYCVGAFWEMSDAWPDLSIVTDSMDTLLCVTLTVHKAYSLITNEIPYKKLIKTVQENFKLPDSFLSPEDKRIIADCERVSRILTAVFISLTFTTVASFLVFPLIEGLVLHNQHNGTEAYEWKVPFKITYPVDIARTEIYVIVYLFHVYVAFLHVFFIPGHDNLVITLLLHACGQFEILNNKLEKLKQNALTKIRDNRDFTSKYSPLKENAMKYESDNAIIQVKDVVASPEDAVLRINDMDEGSIERRPDMDIEMRRTLGRCVEHHQTLIRFVEDLESLVNPVLLDQFLSSSLIFCTTAFLMVAMPLEKAVSMIGLMLASMCQLWMYCFFGDKLKQQSMSVGRAAYFSLWYDAPEDIKKSLLIIMMGSQKPAVLTIGKFVDLSLDTFASALQGSYTYFTLLNEVYGE